MRVSVTIELNRPTIKGLRRRRLLTGAMIAALLVPSAVLASHIFTDVATSYIFHGDISRAKEAGLTAGCSATTFCPEDAVSRGQMTAFLGRSVGRATGVYMSGNVSSTSLVTVGTLTIKAGNPTGGAQQVMLLASFRAKTNVGCPCEMFFGLYKGDGTPLGFDTFVDVAAIPGGQTYTDANASLLGLVIVPTGVEQTFLVKASKPIGTANLEITGRFQAITAPLDGLGQAVHN